MSIFFTSDTHFCHDKDFIFKTRGFSSVEEMNEKIIENWNGIITKDDEVYHLGDVYLNNPEEGIQCFKRLNGSIHLILGNHDTTNKIKNMCAAIPQLDVIGYATIIKYRKYHFYLSHYPCLTNNEHTVSLKQCILNLHGHTHQTNNFLFENNYCVYHVGVDSHDSTPVEIEIIFEELKGKAY